MLEQSADAVFEHGVEPTAHSHHLYLERQRTQLDSRLGLVTTQKSITNTLLGFIYFVLPCGLVLRIFLYDKYYADRAAVLEKQVELLESLWKSDSDNDATTDTGRGAKD